MDYISLVKEYWAIIFIIIFVSGLYFYNRKQAISVAKILILDAEKYAEEYALKNGKEKFAWVSENGYAMLPPMAKIIISRRMFDMIIQYTFDKLIDWAEKEQK